MPFIDVGREFDAPRDLVFRAYTDPSCSSSGSARAKYEMVVDTWESGAGGSWRYVHADADGNECGFHGVFHGEPSPDGDGPDLRVRGCARAMSRSTG